MLFFRFRCLSSHSSAASSGSSEGRERGRERGREEGYGEEIKWRKCQRYCSDREGRRGEVEREKGGAEEGKERNARGKQN